MRVSKLRIALPAAAMAVGLAFGGNAWGATPAITVKPNTKLTNGKVVTVKWSGFAKPTATKGNQYIAIVQCTKQVIVDGDSKHCDTSHPTIIGDGVTKAPAKGTATYAVATGTIGTAGEKCGTKAANKDDCIIGVSGLDATLAPVPGQAASADILFK
jgi:hypothetical protein